MNAVATWLIGATVLFTAALAFDRLLARRRPLAVSALWNAVLVAALALPLATWWLPRWELPLLPPVHVAEPPVRTAENLEWVEVDSAGRVVAVPPPRMMPREEVGPRGLPVPSRPATALDPLPVAPKPSWPNWRSDAAVVLGLAYAGGAVAMLLRLATNLRAVRSLRRRAQAASSSIWLTRCDHWRQRTAPWRAVALLESSEVQVPIVLGWRRPAIVIPDSLASETNPQVIDAILVHELAHVERADCGWQLVECVVQAAYWFHPLVWLARRRIAAVRERACDDFAIHALEDRDAYAETLVEMATRLAAQQRLNRQRQLGLAMAVVRATKLETRLAAIAQSVGEPRVRLSGFVRGTLVIVLLATVTTMLGVRLVRAEAEPAARQNPPGKQAPPVADQPVAQPPETEPPKPATAPATGTDDVDDLFKDLAEKSDEAEYEFHDSAKEDAPQAKEPQAGQTKSTAKETEDKHVTDFALDAFPTRQKETAKTFHKLLRERQFAEAVKLFAPALQKQLPAADLEELIDGLAAQFSPLDPNLVLKRKRAGKQDLLDVLSQWGRHRLSIGFHFNDGNQIDGLWFALDPRYKEIAPELTRFRLKDRTYDLTADELVLGPELARLAGESKSLTVRFVDASGKPIEDQRLSFYRALDAGEGEQPHDWRDGSTGTIWRFITSESRAPNRAERLTPGKYRVMLGWSEKFGHQLSDPIVVGNDQQDVVVDVPLRPAGTLEVQTVDAATGAPLSGSSVQLVADDPKLPPYTIGGNYEESVSTIKGLIPGRHRLTVSSSARRQGEPDYEPSEQFIDIAAGENGPVTVRMRSKEITPADSDQRWPYAVSGRVTDGDGRPVEGATISAWIVWGIERERGHVASDADGRYRLRFGTGHRHAPQLELQATIQITKSGFYDRDSLRREPLVLLNQDHLPKDAREGVKYLMPQQTLELDFVLAPGVDLKTELVDAAGKPVANETLSLLTRQPAGLRHVSGGKTSPQGELATSGISPRDSYLWSLIGDGVFPTRSRPFWLPAAGNYRMRVESKQDERTGSKLLVIVQVLNEAGKDVTAEVVGDDPLLREPLSEEQQAACQQTVDKLLAANRLWLEPPPKDLRYSFEIKFDEIGDNRRMSFELPAGNTTNLSARHGVTYASPLMKLGDRENVLYRAMEVTPGKTVLAYTFKKPVRIMVGNGVDDFWRGSIQSYSREGLLVIDTDRNVPLEVQGDMLVERFDDYRAVSAGQHVPLRINISSSDDWIWRDTRMNFEWEFGVYEPNLWMFQRARNPQAPDGPPIMTLEHLQIDGQPARRLDNLNDRRLVEPPPQR